MNNTLSLKEFLKKFSVLSNEFIDDFYNVYEFNEERNTNFIINIENVAKWLNTKKGKIKETLVKTYNEQIDYIVTKEKANMAISKSNKEIILLTADCFKRLCLLSRTKKGEEVRTYFIELEKLIDKYKNYIINGLRETINILENNQKPIPKKLKGIIYIIKSLKDINGIYRFGQTLDFKKRLVNYNSSNSDKMEVLFMYETKNLKQVEDCVIAQLKEFRYKKRKDFYQIDLDIIKKLIKSCDEMTLSYKKLINQKKSTNKKGGMTENYYLYIQK